MSQDFNFDHLQDLKLEGRTAFVEMPELGHPECAIEIRPASQENPDYFNAQLKANANAQKGRRMRKKAEAVTADKVSAQREMNKRLYKKHVICGWKNLPNADRTAMVPFSPEAAEALVEMLPDWLFDRILIAAQIPEYFLDDDEETPDPGELVGN